MLQVPELDTFDGIAPLALQPHQSSAFLTQQVLNLQPSLYQRDALPLSYANPQRRADAKAPKAINRQNTLRLAVFRAANATKRSRMHPEGHLRAPPSEEGSDYGHRFPGTQLTAHPPLAAKPRTQNYRLIINLRRFRSGV